jgi:hypothetical protein
VRFHPPPPPTLWWAAAAGTNIVALDTHQWRVDHAWTLQWLNPEGANTKARLVPHQGQSTLWLPFNGQNPDTAEFLLHAQW